MCCNVLLSGTADNQPFFQFLKTKGGLFLVPIKHRRQAFTSCIQTFQVWRRGRVKGCMLREATQTKMTQGQHP